MLNAADLPNDIDALKALLLASERRLQERDRNVSMNLKHLVEAVRV
jgi:transposase